MLGARGWGLLNRLGIQNTPTLPLRVLSDWCSHNSIRLTTGQTRFAQTVPVVVEAESRRGYTKAHKASSVLECFDLETELSIRARRHSTPHSVLHRGR